MQPVHVASAQHSVPVMYQPLSELHTYITSSIMPWEPSPAKIISNNYNSLGLVQQARPFLLHSTDHGMPILKAIAALSNIIIMNCITKQPHNNGENLTTTTAVRL